MKYPNIQSPADLEDVAHILDVLDDRLFDLVDSFPSYLFDEVETVCAHLQAAHAEITDAIRQWTRVNYQALKWQNPGGVTVADLAKAFEPETPQSQLTPRTWPPCR